MQVLRPRLDAAEVMERQLMEESLREWEESREQRERERIQEAVRYAEATQRSRERSRAGLVDATDATSLPDWLRELPERCSLRRTALRRMAEAGKLPSPLGNGKSGMDKLGIEAAAERAESLAAELRGGSYEKANRQNGAGSRSEGRFWEQNVREISLCVALPEGSTARDVHCHIGVSTLRVAINDEVLIDDDLHSSVHAGDSCW